MTTTRSTIVFLGDSITAARDGYATSVGEMLRALQPERRWRAINAGVPADRSLDLLSRLARDVLSHGPDIVVIQVGINDVWRAIDSPGQCLDVPLPAYLRAVTAAVDRIEAANARPLLLTTTILGERAVNDGNTRLTPYNAGLRELAAARNLALADVHAAFMRVLSAPDPPRLTTDGVHLTRQGNMVMALTVARALDLLVS